MLALIALHLAGSAAASRLDELGPGTRLRVTVREAGVSIRGTFLAVDGDSALRIDSGHTVVLSLARITRVEQSIGTHRNTRKGALIGLVVGGAASLLIPKKESYGFVDLSGLERDVFRVLAIAAGTVGGAVVGHSAKSDIWEDVDLPSNGGRPSGG